MVEINFDKLDRTLVLAELSCNHLQSFDIAVRTIEAMKKAGADVVKVQNDNPDGGITIDCDNEYFQIGGGTLWDGKTLNKLYKETYTPWEWLPKLQKVAHDLDMEFFSAPSDLEGVDFLEKMNVPAYKVASFEITDTALVRRMASKGRPILISTGIAEMTDIQEAIDICRSEGNNQIALLKCTSSYPTPLEEANVLTIPDMTKRFKVVAGLSDHSMGHSVAVAAVALGAKIVEKHFILSRAMGGPDAAFSMEPDEFKTMVDEIRNTEKALGTVQYETLTANNLRSIRPGQGLHPRYLDELLGRTVNRDVKRGTPMKMEYVQ